MKTIGIIDRGDAGRRMKAYRLSTTKINGTVCMFNQKRIDRIKEALANLRHTGNIDVYLIYGSKHRKLFSKGL